MADEKNVLPLSMATELTTLKTNLNDHPEVFNGTTKRSF